MLLEVKAINWSDVNLRVPLDFHRVDVRALQWKPLMLVNDVTSSQLGLLAVLQSLSMLCDQTASPTPLLVDINIHYRIQRMLYNPAYARWDVQAKLERCPPLFAVWHAYKYCCTVVRRHFFYIERGTVTAWLPSNPHLRNME